MPKNKDAFDNYLHEFAVWTAAQSEQEEKGYTFAQLEDLREILH